MPTIIVCCLADNMTAMMENGDLQSQLEWELYISSRVIYQRFLKNSILGDKHEMLNNILKNVIMPNEVFKWCTLNVHKTDDCLIKSLVTKKLELDNFINTVMRICYDNDAHGCNFIKLGNLYSIVDQLKSANTIPTTLPYKTLLCELVTGGGDQSFSNWNNQDKMVKFQNIMENYKDAIYCIDQAVCDSAYFANVELLRSFIDTLQQHNLHFKFDPIKHVRHQKLVGWIQKNIEIGEKDPMAHLGWKSGPDSGRWPSTNVSDYKNTLCLLCSLM